MDTELHLERLPRTVELVRGARGDYELVYVDQRKLPGELVFARASDWRASVDAIKTLAVRGAPAIGVAGGASVALWAAEEARRFVRGERLDRSARLASLEEASDVIVNARPTAVNLFWAVSRATEIARMLIEGGVDEPRAAEHLYEYAKCLEAADEDVNRAIGENGAALLEPNSRILTHCNAGSLATAFYGTALGVVYAAAAEGKVARVYADETRPVGQGARLTAWELARVGVPVTLICDNMAASLMARGEVDAVVVGADRIAANGDTANKIGTYGVAVLARHHGIPFYVAAPTNTIDPDVADGAGIPIEERAPSEVTAHPLEGVDVWNPAFDVTPAALITAIVTECGVLKPQNCYTELRERQERGGSECASSIVRIRSSGSM